MQQLLEFTLDPSTPAGVHRMRTGAGSVLEFTSNGEEPPARLVVMYGARSDRAVPVTVLERDAAGRPVLVRLPGGAGGRIRFAPLDVPAADRAEAVLLVPIAQLPRRRTVRFVDDVATPRDVEAA